ncbi:TATA-binding protein interacting [Phlyctema vagabunda]|uniref:TATA-binding protein interacting n=1 Tax=Phlyctema vagabunda TaxID=108571 RepID=A0ABR4PK85_9HELO
MSNSISPNPTSQTVAALLPKLQDADPDYRFMSLNDLLQVLTIGKQDILYNDYNTAARAVDGILKTLDDQNGEVQNLAIKCLGPLVTRLPSSILGPLIEKLSNLSTENSVDNSVPAMALRSVVVTLPRPVVGVAHSPEVVEAYAAISRVLIPRLVGRLVVLKPAKLVKLPPPPPGMLELDGDNDISPEAVDVLIEVVRCFGPLLAKPEVEALQHLLVCILESERASAVVKKRTVVAVSILALYLADEALSGFVSKLIESLRQPHLTNVQRRLYITILGSMARSIPSRFGPYLKTLTPFVLSALSEQELEEQRENAAEDGEPDPEVDDVRESALVALESFLASCGGEMRLYTEEAIAAALLFLKYDPNYNDDDDEEMSGTQSDDDGMSDFGDDDDFEQDAGFDDDDDASWKVRRCAAKVLYTIISTRGNGDLLDDGTLYTAVAPVLVQRFNEREENVRLEVITTLASLVRKTGGGVVRNLSIEEGGDYLGPAPQSRKRRRESSTATSFDTKALLSLSAGLTSPVLEQVPASGPKADLARLSPAIIKVTTKLLKSSSVPTKQSLIGLLNDMIAVQNGGLSDYLGQLVDPITDALKSASTITSSTSAVGASATTTTLRVAALRLIGDISKTHSSATIQAYLSKILPAVVSAVNDKYYKISAEAIATVEQFIKALTPPRSKSLDQGRSADLHKLFEVIVDRVAATDADVEVRQRAIHALGILLARTASSEGASLLSSSDRTLALEMLNDRLKNETTRIAAVRAIDTVAALTTGKGQLQPKWICEVSIELSAQLRKANRSLRGASLGALKNLVISPSARNALDVETIQGLATALLPLLTASDLHLLGPALLVLAALVQDDARIVVTEQLTAALCDLLTSVLGGSVLDAVLVLVTNIGEAGAGKSLMVGLLQDVSMNGDPAVVGKVIGTLLVAGGSSVGVTINSFLTEVKSSGSDEARQSLALAVLGEAGLRLGVKSPLEPAIFIAQFDSPAAKVPLAAAVALGRAGAGNIPVYLPEILSTMDKGGNAQYLLLHSIKEILLQAVITSADITKYTKPVWDRLLSASQSEDNKAIGAECIGRLAIIDPKFYIPQLQTYLQDESPSVRAMVIQALRYTLPDSDETFDTVLRTTLVDMLVTMMQDSELENRRLALTTLNSAARNKPDLILPHLGQLLPLVMKESVIHPELIREVMMGPFKHKVDDGLEVRKSAYETLYALMETAFSRINVLDFYDRVMAGLQDEHDIRSLCNLMLAKLVVLDQDETGRRLDDIAKCFRAILMIKLKDTAVKQEIEKQDEAIKGALRITLLLHAALPDASAEKGSQQLVEHQVWREYWEWVEKDFEPQLKALKEETKEKI